MIKKIKFALFGLICAATLFSPPIYSNAATHMQSVCIYEDINNERIVYDLEAYINLLNEGFIAPKNSYEQEYAPLDLSEPSEKCSNIFGHKWGDWHGWREIGRGHGNSMYDLVIIERSRMCTRTHCTATQSETDHAWVQCSH